LMPTAGFKNGLQKSSNSPPNKAFKKCMPAPRVAGRAQLAREHFNHHNTQADGRSNSQSDRCSESWAMQAQVDAHGWDQKWVAKVLQQPTQQSIQKVHASP
jgi:hypothetical protein